MAGMIWTVTTEFESGEDAVALAELITELGYQPAVSSRTFAVERHPIRDTRLGRIILRFMAENRTHSYSIEDCQDVCVKHEYKATSAAAALSVLVKEGDLTRDGRGLYRLA